MNIQRFVQREFRAALMGLAALLQLAPSYAAYPDRPIRLIVPFPAGGATNTFARVVAQSLTESLGRPVVVDNRGGANGNIGLEAAARAPADGYTLFMTATSIDSINPPLLKGQMHVDPEVSMMPVAFVARVPNVIVVNPSAPAQRLGELIPYFKSDSNTNFGSFGVGTTTRVGWVQFEQAANFSVHHIPYKGDAQMMVDLIGNVVQVSMPTVVAAAPFVRDGKLRALAVTSAQRSPVMPDVPTVAESGYPGYEASTWFGISAPAGTPPESIRLLNHHINQAITSARVIKTFQEGGASTTPMSVEAFTQFLATERKRWTQIVLSSGIKPE